jgi:serine/threonine protein kinase
MIVISCTQCNSTLTGETRFCPTCGTKVENTSASEFGRLRELYDQGLSVHPSNRESWLREVCGGDESLRNQLMAMLAATASAPPPVQTNQERSSIPMIGPYRILRELGRGGMGLVYLAVRDDGTFRKNVALKLLLRDQVNAEFIRRFKHERQVLAALDHPNIARILDGGDAPDGTPYYVMEYVEGIPIDKYCDEHRLSLTARLKLFQQVCHAVDYLHQNLIVHRDLKPSNILVSPAGVIKLLDFGIAKLIGAAAFSAQDMTVPGNGPMTPTYASPEQLSGGTLDKTSDIYSLGVVLYRLLTGRAPYEGLEEKVSNIAARRLPPCPSKNIREDLQATESTAQLRRALMGELDSIVLMPLNVDSKLRYQSAADFSNDLQKFLDGLPVTAHHANVAQRSVKLIKRRRAIIAALICILLLGGLGIFQWRRAAIAETEIAQRESKLRTLLDQLETGLNSSDAVSRTSEQKIADVKVLQRALQTDYAALAARPPDEAKGRGPLIDRGIRYLDRLRAANNNDNRLGLEIASTYHQFGVVQETSLPRTPPNNTVIINTYHKAVVILVGISPTQPEAVLAKAKLDALSQRIQSLGGTIELAQAAVKEEEPVVVRPRVKPRGTMPEQEPAKQSEAPPVAVPSAELAEIEEKLVTVASRIQIAHEAIEPIRLSLEAKGQMLNAETSTAARRMHDSLATARRQVVSGDLSAAKESLAAAEAFASRVLRTVGR